MPQFCSHSPSVQNIELGLAGKIGHPTFAATTGLKNDYPRATGQNGHKPEMKTGSNRKDKTTKDMRTGKGKVIIFLVTAIISFFYGGSFTRAEENATKCFHYNLSKIETRYLVPLYAGPRNKPLEVKPGEYVSFTGPRGAFIIALGNNKSEQTIYAMSRDEAVIQRDNGIGFRYRVHPIYRRSLLHLGYYYPDKETGKSIQPPKDAAVEICVTGAGEFEQRFIDRIRHFFSWGASDPVEPYGKNVKIFEGGVNSAWAHGGGIISLLVFFYGIYLWRKIAKETSEDIAKPHNASSMRSLYRTGQRKFLCVHCGQPLKTVGRFQCRVGHIPDHDVNIFKKCSYRGEQGICPDVFEYMRCHHCGGEIALDQKYYNQEEIENRGKKYIMRKNPYKVQLWPYFLTYAISGLIMIAAVSVNEKGQPYIREIYESLYGSIAYMGHFFFPGLYYFLFITVIYFGLNIYLGQFKKDVIIENPYEKRKT